METANKILSDTLYAAENKYSTLKKIKRTITDLGYEGVSLSVIFLFVYTYLGYYKLTGISLGEMQYMGVADDHLIYMSVLFYLLYMFHVITSVDMNKICKKYKVSVIK